MIDDDEAEDCINHIELLRDSSHICSYSPRLWNRLLINLPLNIKHNAFYKDEYKLPQWFDRMDTKQSSREEVFRIPHNLSEKCKAHYPYSEDFITTYHIEIVAENLA